MEGVVKKIYVNSYWNTVSSFAVRCQIKGEISAPKINHPNINHPFLPTIKSRSLLPTLDRRSQMRRIFKKNTHPTDPPRIVMRRKYTAVGYKSFKTVCCFLLRMTCVGVSVSRKSGARSYKPTKQTRLLAPENTGLVSCDGPGWLS